MVVCAVLEMISFTLGVHKWKTKQLSLGTPLFRRRDTKQVLLWVMGQDHSKGQMEPHNQLKQSLII